jgi:hypothetical protein
MAGARRCWSDDQLSGFGDERKAAFVSSANKRDHAAVVIAVEWRSGCTWGAESYAGNRFDHV